MSNSAWDPNTYPSEIRTEIPLYDHLQDIVVKVSSETRAHDILDLGTGSGETARRLLDALPGARLHGLDSSEEMLAAARSLLPRDRVMLDHRRLEDPLPEGPFDLAVSALTVHHLPGDHKRGLFQRVANVLRPGGCFVLGDVVVPDDPAKARITLEVGFDFPSTVGEQLEWFRTSGFLARVVWSDGDLAVLQGDLVTT